MVSENNELSVSRVSYTKELSVSNVSVGNELSVSIVSEHINYLSDYITTNDLLTVMN
jgi:hypothetical protein